MRASHADGSITTLSCACKCDNAHARCRSTPRLCRACCLKRGWSVDTATGKPLPTSCCRFHLSTSGRQEREQYHLPPLDYEIPEDSEDEMSSSSSSSGDAGHVADSDARPPNPPQPAAGAQPAAGGAITLDALSAQFTAQMAALTQLMTSQQQLMAAQQQRIDRLESVLQLSLPPQPQAERSQSAAPVSTPVQPAAPASVPAPSPSVPEANDPRDASPARGASPASAASVVGVNIGPAIANIGGLHFAPAAGAVQFADSVSASLHSMNATQVAPELSEFAAAQHFRSSEASSIPHRERHSSNREGQYTHTAASP